MILTHPEQYMSTREAAVLWGYPQNTVSRWCQTGKIPGAEQVAPYSPWLIPRNAPQKKQIKTLPREIFTLSWERFSIK